MAKNNPHAVALGRLGGLKGGPARAKNSSVGRSERTMPAAAAILAVGLVAGCGTPPIDPTVDFENVSVINLIATPKKYHGEKIRVIGYLSLERDREALYLNRDFEERDLIPNSIWIDVPQEMESVWADKNKRHVIIEGTFDAKHRGHGGLHSGKVHEITRLHPWRADINEPDMKGDSVVVPKEISSWIESYLSTRPTLKKSIAHTDASKGWLGAIHDGGYDSGRYCFVATSGYSEVFTETDFGWSDIGERLHNTDAAKKRIVALLKNAGQKPEAIEAVKITEVIRVFLRPSLGETHPQLPLALYYDAEGTPVAVRRHRTKR